MIGKITITEVSARDDVRAKIHNAMARQGITQNELADRMGVTRQSISKTLQNGNMTINTLESIARALGRELIIEFSEKEGETT